VTQQLSNYVQTTLASACTNIATTISVVSAAGLPTSGNFMLRIDDVAPATTFEYAECTGVSGTTLTVTRGQEGTTGIAHSAGAFVGNDLTAAMILRAFPQGVLSGGYAQITADISLISTLVALTGLSITVTPPTGRRIRVSAYVGYSGTVSTDTAAVTLMDGATSVSSDQGNASGAAGNVGTLRIDYIIVGDGASHTYSLKFERSVGTGTFTIIATGTQYGVTYGPCWIMAEDIGSN